MVEHFDRKVRRLRDRTGLNQSELAQALGLSEQSKGYISEIESGKKISPAETILKIALYFNVTTDYLLCGDLSEVGDQDI